MRQTNLLLHFILEPPQQVRSYQVFQSRRHRQGEAFLPEHNFKLIAIEIIELCYLRLGCVYVTSLHDGLGKVRREQLRGAQHPRHYKIEETPQFLQVVLHR